MWASKAPMRSFGIFLKLMYYTRSICIPFLFVRLKRTGIASYWEDIRA